MKILTGLACLFLCKVSLYGFSLLGPYAGWMQQTNGYQKPGDIGGPMSIGLGYRWNVPVVTYAFDKSFLDFFGSNGVAAVEGAIGMLNALPSSSDIDLTNFPKETLRYNFAAQAQQLYDLKSATLALLLEHLGLGQPTRNVFDLKQWSSLFLTQADEASWPPGTIPNLIIERNFDPETLSPTHYVNGVHYTGSAEKFSSYWDIVEVTDNPGEPSFTSVADFRAMQPAGAYCSGLTRDDVGGLRYLLSTNTQSFETLLPDVHGTGTNSGSFVNQALRPGLEKLTFLRQDLDPLTGEPVAVTNDFVDAYIMNNTVNHQLLERVILQPDFLFLVTDSGDSVNSVYIRSGTSNWWNSAVVTGGTNQTGPGVIMPPVKIAFDKRGPAVTTTDSNPAFADLQNYSWGTFDSSANVISYPIGAEFAGADSLTVHLWLGRANAGLDSHVDWKVPVALGATASLETSTNLTDWVPLTSVTNLTGSLSWYHWRTQPAKYFRVVPQ